ncbi:MAG: adenylate/guanylate cyclase domain-containing protein [Deltaproteobacteria bacterium]|nr:MAG: adenylate/guanylate cyclase domain-containing protein [Deltaproteobacteria bacterium]
MLDSDAIEKLSLTEILTLQNDLSRMLLRRFGAQRALVFTDVVGSTNYFQAHGDEAGRRLLQRHNDVIAAKAEKYGGRVIDTAGDGAFSAFPEPVAGASALIELFEAIARENLDYPFQHQLLVRAGLHFGDVLTDGAIVTGDAVNVSARVASVSTPGEIRVSRSAFDRLPAALRTRCSNFRTDSLKGVAVPIDTMVLHWRNPALFSTSVLVAESGQKHMLPMDKDLIRFGRLGVFNGEPANDVVLSHPDPEALRKVSRWHFELRRLPDGFFLRQLSKAGVTVNGKVVAAGEDVPLPPGSVVVVSGVLKLEFSQPPRGEAALAETIGL